MREHPFQALPAAARDLEGRIHYWGSGLEALYGWSRGEAEGRLSQELLRTEYPAPLPQLQAELLATGRWHGELLRQRADGSRIRVTSHWSLQRDERLNLVTVLEFDCETTETRRDLTCENLTSENLTSVMDGETRFRAIADGVPLLISMMAPDQGCVFVNRRWIDITGRPVESALGSGWTESLHPEDRESVLAMLAAAEKRREPFTVEFRLRQADQSYARWACNAKPRFGENGQLLGHICTCADIGARKEVQEALRLSEALFRTTFEQAGVGMAHFDLDGHCLRVNDRLCAITGYSREELLGFGLDALIHPDDAEHDRLQAKALRDGRIQSYAVETHPPRKNGESVLIRVTRTVVRDDAGKAQYFLTVVEDFDQGNPLVQTLVPLLQGLRKRLADSEEQSEARYRSLYQRTPALMFSTDSCGSVINTSDYWLEHMGYEAEEVICRPICNFMTPASAAKYRAILPGLMVGGELRDAEFQFIRKSGEIIDTLVSSRVESWEAGTKHSVSVLIDITARKEAERRLLRSEELRRLAVEGAQLGIWLWDLYTGELSMSATCQELLCIPPGDPPSYENLLQAVHADDRAQFASTIFRCLEQGGEFEGEYRVPMADGSLRWLYTKGRGTQDSDGRVHRLQGITTDVTEHKLAEEALAHSQKLEMVGQITGGIAHDFNNYLCIIIGNLEHLEKLAENDPKLRKRIGVMTAAAERAAHLTSKLLAFSRRQELRPERLDIAAILFGIEDLLRQTIPQTIRFELDLPEMPSSAFADRHQLETAILNLVLNARDAMPAGGRLSIEAADVTVSGEQGHRHQLLAPGNYLGITVADTGYGMSPAVQKRALEPFFTTKQPGKGTGLGLSQVYGFLRQSGGHIEIRSAEGAGTQIRMLLPRSEDQSP